jgi:hypothetical protein
LAKLTQEKVEKLKGTVTIKEIQSLIEILSGW